MTRVGGIGGNMVPPRRVGRSAGGFALPRSEAGTESTATAAAGPVAALLGLQEAPEPPEAVAERAARQGERMLEELQALQLELLRGREDPARLERLAALAPRIPEVADPVLRAALAGIVARARVELARRRRASAAGV